MTLVPKHTPGSIDSLARDALRLSRRWGAGRLASWLPAALVLVYGVWFFGFATVHNGPTATLPVRALASDRPFSDLQSMRALLAAEPEQRKHKTGVDQPTTWLMATIPGVETMHGVPQRTRTIHIPEKSIELADVALLDTRGDARLWARFGVGVPTYKSQRALPGFARDHQCHLLVWFEEQQNMYWALQRERNIKHWVRQWKNELIEAGNPEWDDLYLGIAQG